MRAFAFLAASVFGLLLCLHLTARPGLARQADQVLARAEVDFEAARTAFRSQDIKAGNDRLDDMLRALNEAVESLEASGKGNAFKKAEIRVGTLQRRMRDLVDDIGIEDRAWPEQVERRLAELRGKLLAGAMRK